MDREKVSLTGAPETMLATLYLRAEASKAPNPILVDRAAEQAVQRLDYDFRKLNVRSKDAPSVAIRAKALDRWVQERLATDPDVTVLHLGCGLDSRAFRLDVPASVEWYDVDLPQVIELRRRLYAERPHHHTIASSVTDPSMLDAVPAGKPVLVVAEGLTMYLSEQDGERLFRGIVDHFPRGELIFDAFSRLGVRLSNRFNPVVVGAGAHLEWGINDPRTLPKAVPGLVFDTEWSFTESPELDRYPVLGQKLYRALGHITAVRRMGRLLRYHFGEEPE